jgi:O-antigen/teichoic acid export membrane protein
LGFKLPGIVALILIARFGALSALVALNFHIIPKLKQYSGSFSLFTHLLAFGGWVTVSSIVSPILVYTDRFLIGSLVSMSAVAYYTAPYEAATRLWIIPGSLAMTLFPAFSTLGGSGERRRLGTLFARSIKYVLLALGPVGLLLVLFAQDILQVWLGSEFASRSTVVMQILILGVLINSLAQIPYVLLQGVGRPDITAKFHLLELFIYVGLAWLLISRWGIIGAAVAWALRVALDALFLFVASFKVCGLSPSLLATEGLTIGGFALVLLAVVAYWLKSFVGILPLFAQSIVFVALFGLFIWLVWRKVLDASERGAMFNLLKSWQKP